MSRQSKADKMIGSSKRVRELEARVAELTAALQRERADAENMRRRHGEQIGSLERLVKANVVRELLPIVDNCERLLQHVTGLAAAKPWRQGVEQIVKQMNKTLADLGVKRVKTIGQVFDPRWHEAVSLEEAAGSPTGKGVERVCGELRAGYTLGDEVIRPATVNVRTEKK